VAEPGHDYFGNRVAGPEKQHHSRLRHVGMSAVGVMDYALLATAVPHRDVEVHGQLHILRHLQQPVPVGVGQSG
jgi:hypothetical protein